MVCPLSKVTTAFLRPFLEPSCPLNILLLPLEFESNYGIEELGIVKTDRFSVLGIKDVNDDNKILNLVIEKQNGEKIHTKLKARLDTPDEVIFWKNGGILPTAWKEA